MIYDELVDELGFDPADGPEECIRCEEPSPDLDHQDMCPQCVENARGDRGNQN